MTRTMLRDSRPASLTALLLGLLAASPARAQVVEYYHTDAIGNVRAITDASGNVIERHDYQPYGEEWLPQGGTQPLRFTGKERDAETGLDYFGARYYGSKIGRFTTVDPYLDLAGRPPRPPAVEPVRVRPATTHCGTWIPTGGTTEA